MDICDLIDYSLMLCNHKLTLSDIVAETACDPDLPRVVGNFNQLQQCLINLIFNAVDAIWGHGDTIESPRPAGINVQVYVQLAKQAPSP